ncbi:LytR/AlgR family response regulator transcription factor [Fulvivirga ligni]|uniref:LytR/AlgR family response regulator transcription factor n=1 Tax=Fulvivirga ligni TaxID=2904246 RepID=UPI001F281BEC|nr:LytTR family DNA-binding domain-containing protein [Fulvivirga ligni]UII20515.1 LytTR family transcriptional regulator [Fulvivirga ligni]
MKSLLNISLTNLFAISAKQVSRDRVLYGLTMVVSLLAVLELAQDYVTSMLHGSSFFISQSLSYKLFWLLFIPFSYLMLSLKEVWRLKSRYTVFAKAIAIILITVLHLLAFSLLLHLLSYGISDTPWSFLGLITQKLSTRLYLALTFYILFTVVYDHFRTKSTKPGSDDVRSNNFDTLPVKQGSKTTLVETHQINRICSDGPYLEVFTADKKYVVLDSLKNIINVLPENFLRIHKSTIVNIHQIESSKSRGNGDYDLTLKCGETVRLSRNYAKTLKDILHQSIRL